MTSGANNTDAPQVAVGLIGTAFMGRAHSRALVLLRTLEDRPAAVPRLAVVCGRNEVARDSLRKRFGWESAVDDWRRLVADPRLAIVSNAAANDVHAAPVIEAVQAGKHVICEKPLARTAAEARAMFDAAHEAEVRHMTAFNYRFFPAVRLASDMITAGDIGTIRHFRSRFLLSSNEAALTNAKAWRRSKAEAGSGVVGDLLAHHVDLARHLVGEPIAVSASARTWPTDGGTAPGDVEDSVACTMEFAQGAIGVLEASRSTPGHTVDSIVEIDGSKGSLRFDVRRLNQLVVSTPMEQRVVDATNPRYPDAALSWPAGHDLGWGDSLVLEMRHFLGAVAGAWNVAPRGATFWDGYRCAVICDATLESVESGRRIQLPSVSRTGSYEERAVSEGNLQHSE